MITFGQSQSTSQDIQTYLINFCREEAFKKYVRESINNELFFQNLCRDYKLDSKIEAKVKEQILLIKQDLDKLVKKKLKELLPKSVTHELNTQLPNQLLTQLPIYLNNNYQMKQILDNHSYQLNEHLSNLTKQTLDRITNEEQYQMVTASHLNNMALRYNESVANQLQEQNNKFNENTLANTRTFNATLKNIEQSANSSLSNFNEFNAKANIMSSEIDRLNKKLSELQKSRDKTDTFLQLIGLFSVVVGVFNYLTR